MKISSKSESKLNSSYKITLRPETLSVVAENCRRLLATLDHLIDGDFELEGPLKLPDLLSGALELIDDKYLVLGRTKLSLTQRPLTLSLVKALLAHADLKASRNELMIKIFECDVESDYSDRYKYARGQNLSKLISRARTFLSDAFEHELPEGARWLVHDHKEETWALLRIS